MFGRSSLLAARRAFATRTVIATPNAPAALGPYSQAIVRGNDVYVSGQLGLDPVTGALTGDHTAQAEQALKNMKAILEASGSSCEEVMKCLVFITDMKHFGDINKVYTQYFPTNAPARSCVAVKELPRGALFEIECVANKKN